MSPDPDSEQQKQAEDLSPANDTQEPAQPIEQFNTNPSPEGTRPDTADDAVPSETQSDVPADQLASDGDQVVEGVSEETEETQADQQTEAPSEAE